MRGFFIAPKKHISFRCLSGLVAAFLTTSLVLTPITVQAQTVMPVLLNLPVPGTMIQPTPAFMPVLLKGMTIHPDDPLKFDFIIDSGNTEFDPDQVKQESEKLVKYFLAAMTVPKDDLWVNLSPNEPDRIIPNELGKTELGRDMLAQDYILKQLTASLIYPEKELGKKFWDRVYKKAEEQFGTSEIPMNTFNKVWILPETASVYEHENTVYVVSARLKVMLDEDKEGRETLKEGSEKLEVRSEKSELQSEIIREIIIPEIEKEVNEGAHFAPLRQIYHSLILAKWYKETIKNSLLSQVYVDQNMTDGIQSDDAAIKDKIYARYMEAYKKGVFNYIKEDYDRLSDEMIPRKYFSGGIDKLTNIALKHTSSPVEDSENLKYKAVVEVAPQKDGASSPIKGSNQGESGGKVILNLAGEENFQTNDVKNIWNFIKDEIERSDPQILQKKEGVLSRIIQHIKTTLHSIDLKIASGKIKMIDDLHLLKEEGVDESVGKEPVRMGVLGFTSNPLTFGHIAAALSAIDELDLNMLVFLVQGGMKYKDIMEQDRIPEKVRHEFAEGASESLAPLIKYTDISRNSEMIAEYQLYKLLALNPNRKIDLFYGVGSETEQRVRGVIKNALKASEKYRSTKSPQHTVHTNIVPIDDFKRDSLTDEKLLQLVQEIKEQESMEGVPILIDVMLEDYDLAVHSTSYRRGDRSLVPFSVDEIAQEQGLYGYPPTVIRDGEKVTITMDEVIRNRLSPMTKRLAKVIENMFAHKGAIITIDGNSASGKSLVAELLLNDLKNLNRSSVMWGLDTELKDREYRLAVQKLVIGGELDPDELMLIPEEERESIKQGNEYLDEVEFFKNKEIYLKLRGVKEFFESGDEKHALMIENPYDQKTKKIKNERMEMPLEKDSILIVEGKYSNLPMMQEFSDYRVRIFEDPESVKVRFELRTRRQSPNDADQQLIFFRKGLTPSYDKYVDETEGDIDVLFDVSSAYPEQWELKISEHVRKGQESIADTTKDFADNDIEMSSNTGASAVAEQWMKDRSERYSVEELEVYAANIRLDVVRIWKTLKGPLSGALSIADLYTAFFLNYVNKEKYSSGDEGRVRFIPKGTSAGALYSAAAFAGLIDPNRIIDIDKDDLEVVPTKSGFSDASLYKMGMQLEQGVGMALAAKYRGDNYPIVVFLTDGGLQLGVDHPAKFAAGMHLNNLTLIVDVNGLQSAYKTDQVDPFLAKDEQGRLTNQQKIWESYGWEVIEIDGHNFKEIQDAYDQIGKGDKPLIILAKTVKGKGVPFMESNVAYNHKVSDDAELARMEKILQDKVSEYKRGGMSVEYSYDWDIGQVTKDLQGRSVPDVKPQSGMDLETYLKQWLEKFSAENYDNVVLINTDNPAPFSKDTPIYSPSNHSPHIFAGINERFALNLAGGLSNENISPIYVGPAAHMPILAEDWKMYAIDKQDILVVSRSAGSAMSNWGPAHLTFEDVELFKTPGANVYQPATPQDLRVILENHYGNENPSAAYIRLQETEDVLVSATLFDSKKERKKLFSDGFYEVDSFSPDNAGDQEFTAIIVSGKTVAEGVKAGQKLKEQNIPYKIINVINLSMINKEKFSADLENAHQIITAIDAKPESLSTIVFDAIIKNRDRIMSFGVSDGGNFSGEQMIMKANKIDADGLYQTAVSGLKGELISEGSIGNEQNLLDLTSVSTEESRGGLGSTGGKADRSSSPVAAVEEIVKLKDGLVNWENMERIIYSGRHKIYNAPHQLITQLIEFPSFMESQLLPEESPEGVGNSSVRIKTEFPEWLMEPEDQVKIYGFTEEVFWNLMIEVARDDIKLARATIEALLFQQENFISSPVDSIEDIHSLGVGGSVYAEPETLALDLVSRWKGGDKTRFNIRVAAPKTVDAYQQWQGYGFTNESPDAGVISGEMHQLFKDFLVQKVKFNQKNTPLEDRLSSDQEIVFVLLREEAEVLGQPMKEVRVFLPDMDSVEGALTDKRSAFFNLPDVSNKSARSKYLKQISEEGYQNSFNALFKDTVVIGRFPMVLGGDAARDMFLGQITDEAAERQAYALYIVTEEDREAQRRYQASQQAEANKPRAVPATPPAAIVQQSRISARRDKQALEKQQQQMHQKKLDKIFKNVGTQSYVAPDILVLALREAMDLEDDGELFLKVKRVLKRIKKEQTYFWDKEAEQLYQTLFLEPNPKLRAMTRGLLSKIGNSHRYRSAALVFQSSSEAIRQLSGLAWEEVVSELPLSQRWILDLTIAPGKSLVPEEIRNSRLFEKYLNWMPFVFPQVVSSDNVSEWEKKVEELSDQDGRISPPSELLYVTVGDMRRQLARNKKEIPAELRVQVRDELAGYADDDLYKDVFNGILFESVKPEVIERTNLIINNMMGVLSPEELNEDLRKEWKQHLKDFSEVSTRKFSSPVQEEQDSYNLTRRNFLKHTAALILLPCVGCSGPSDSTGEQEPDLSAWSVDELINGIYHPSWLYQRASAKELFNRLEAAGVGAPQNLISAVDLARNELVWPRIGRMDVSDGGFPVYSLDYKQIIQLGRITVQPLKDNLYDLNANTDTRKWSIRLLGEIGNFDEVYDDFDAVFRNTGGMFMEWHLQEAINGFALLIIRQGDGVDLINTYMNRANGYINGVRAGAARAAAALVDERTRDAVTEGLNDPYELVRYWSNIALNRLNAASSPVSLDSLLNMPTGLIGALEEKGRVVSTHAGEVFDISFFQSYHEFMTEEPSIGIALSGLGIGLTVLMVLGGYTLLQERYSKEGRINSDIKLLKKNLQSGFVDYSTVESLIKKLGEVSESENYYNLFLKGQLTSVLSELLGGKLSTEIIDSLRKIGVSDKNILYSYLKNFSRNKYQHKKSVLKVLEQINYQDNIIELLVKMREDTYEHYRHDQIEEMLIVLGRDEYVRERKLFEENIKEMIHSKIGSYYGLYVSINNIFEAGRLFERDGGFNAQGVHHEAIEEIIDNSGTQGPQLAQVGSEESWVVHISAINFSNQGEPSGVLHDPSGAPSSPVTSDDPGGIDMNNIDVDRQGGGVHVEFDPVPVQEIIDMGITGFTPVIINLTPLPSVLPLLGLAPQRDEEFEVSSLN